MSLLSLKDFILKQKRRSDFKITDYYELRGVCNEDRDNVEAFIKEAIQKIQNEDIEKSHFLKEFCEEFSAGDYMILRSDECKEYWEQKRLSEQYKTSKRSTEEEADKRRSKRLKTKLIFPSERDEILNGFLESVGTTIKRQAHEIYMGKCYSKLDQSSKDIISNGFNSILDLTDNKNQKLPFTVAQWTKLKELWQKKKNWRSLETEISDELKHIEKLADGDIKEAYKTSLAKQIQYAFTPNEAYFKVYSTILSSLNLRKSIYSFSAKNQNTEEDYVIKVWAPIISAVFDDLPLFCKWGDSISNHSTEAKKTADPSSSTVGDKVDCRICTKGSDGKIMDLINIEFANTTQDWKYHVDHRKILRESKVMADIFYESPFLKPRYKRNIKVHSIQIAGVEGQVVNVGLADNGIYVASKLGSLRLPTSGLEMRKARTLLQRLFDLKRDAKYLVNCYASLSHEKSTAVNNMDLKQNSERSPYDEESIEELLKSRSSDKYCNW
ncbi:hypothetical protein DFQ28_000181, partial [Apophysomyces sp. BC1034]